MACIARLNGTAERVEQPAGGWTAAAVVALVGPSPMVKTLDTAGGRFTFVTEAGATYPNLSASMETGLHLLGDVLVIPPAETITRS